MPFLRSDAEWCFCGVAAAEVVIEITGVLMTYRKSDQSDRERKNLKFVDVFSGCGGLSAGVKLAGESAGYDVSPCCAVDLSKSALSVYGQNFETASTVQADIYDVIDFQVRRAGGEPRFAFPPELCHPRLRGLTDVDLLLGGPPCQGNSNLNNHSRNKDPRNLYYLAMPALAAAIRPSAIVIENVPEVIRANKRVVEQTSALLRSLGYFTYECVLSAERFGVPQRRRRHFLIASAIEMPCAQIAESYESESAVTAGQVLQAPRIDGDPLDAPATLSLENQARIDYLFDNDLYDLPNHQRPKCHRNGNTYPSVYGRINPNSPATTVTGGFMTPGRGRYIHPYERRGLTLREGARLQSFPEWYSFMVDGELPASRTEMAQMIGDSVPPLLARIAVAIALDTFMSSSQSSAPAVIDEA